MTVPTMLRSGAEQSNRTYKCGVEGSGSPSRKLFEALPTHSGKASNWKQSWDVIGGKISPERELCLFLLSKGNGVGDVRDGITKEKV
jgi:hypothetical protein